MQHEHSERFEGYCERLHDSVNIHPMLEWITKIDFHEWPQQHPHFGEIRPAMINDRNWHHFGRYADELLLGCRSFDKILAYPNEARAPMLSVVMPGHYIHSHVDPQPPDWVVRIHVPLMTNRESCIFMDRAYHLEIGCAYKINTERKHAIMNHGDTPRIHFMFDIFNREYKQ